MITTKEYIQLYNKFPNPNDNSKYHTHYEGEQEDFNKLIEYNKHLVERFPFLLPRNRWTDEVVEEYDYSYTEMDSMPQGWRLAFGDLMLEELRAELNRFNYLTEYRIIQIKEKFGELRWYDGGSPIGELGEPEEIICTDKKYPKHDFNTDNYTFLREENNVWVVEHRKILDRCTIHNIVDKYSDMSRKICIHCGKPATYVSTDWISPWCTECKKGIDDIFVEIDEWFKEEQ